MRLNVIKFIKFILCILLIAAMIFFIIALVRNGKNKNGQGNEENTPSATEEPGNTPDPGSPTADPVVNPTGEPENTSSPAPTESGETLPLKGVVIYINAGHQGSAMNGKESTSPWDLSTTKTQCTSGTEGRFTHVAEHVVTLQIALKLQALCEEQGATVVMSRTTDNVTKSNVDRAKEANACNAAIALHIHCNGAESESAKGVDIYCRGNGDGSAEYAESSKRDAALGKSLLDEVCEAAGARRRDVYKSDEYSTINWAEMPSLIVECGFMSNEEEDNLLVTDEYQQKLAQGMLRFLVKNFGIALW